MPVRTLKTAFPVSLKQSVKDLLHRYAKTPLPLLRRLNAVMRTATAMTHRWQLELEWGVPPLPEWFDHFIDQQCWTAPFPWERGIFNLIAMRQGARVLDMCCGDGFFDRRFYAGRAREIIAADIDPRAIRHARRYNAAPNIHYQVGDVRAGLPAGPFDNVVWDAAIEHFTEAEIADVLSRIKRELRPGGVLSGYTIQAMAHGASHPDHEYEFSSKVDLARFFTPHFQHVQVLETVYPDRHNLYVFASDEVLPLDRALLSVDGANRASLSAASRAPASTNACSLCCEWQPRGLRVAGTTLPSDAKFLARRHRNDEHGRALPWIQRSTAGARHHDREGGR